MEGFMNSKIHNTRAIWADFSKILLPTIGGYMKCAKTIMATTLLSAILFLSACRGVDFASDHESRKFKMQREGWSYDAAAADSTRCRPGEACHRFDWWTNA